MIFYLATVLTTLAFTELGKASFATTRPQVPISGYAAIYNSDGNSIKWKRRFGSLVASLKSKHSFPSGDSAQAMNLCLFFLRYVPVSSSTVMLGNYAISIRDAALFSLFLPGVLFARVFYLCHWVEDCIGGVMLSMLIHWLVIPSVCDYIAHFARISHFI